MEEIISAIATPRGKGGVAIIRISGEGALALAEKMFSPVGKIAVKDFEPYRMYPGQIDAGNFSDYGLCVYFKAPKSYTGEDIVEFQCHGGESVARGILKQTFLLGARSAGKGEFTKRAFLNGKLSLASVTDGYKGVIFYLPEKMNQETANRLLKMVEEPPVKTLFLFITHAPEKVLQTIFSRCQSIRVLPLTKEESARVQALKPESDKEEYSVFMDLFADLMNAIVSRNLMSALECGEAMAALESREKQKAFCIFASECLRKIFLIQQNLPQIADVPQEEQEFYQKMATGCGKKFCSRSIPNIEKVVAMIDRNVNAKMLFCDLVNRMFLSV